MLAAAGGAYIHGLTADIAVSEEKTHVSAELLLKYLAKAVEKAKYKA